MRIAIVLQPLDRVDLPFTHGSSLAIVGYNFARELASAGHEIILYCGGKEDGRVQEEGNLKVVTIHTPLDKAFKLADRVTGICEISPPLMTRKSYFASYFKRVAQALADDTFDIVHVSTYFQFMPIFREAAPEAALLLHMHGETASMAPSSVLEPALPAIDLAIGCSQFIVDRLVEAAPALASRNAVLWNGVDHVGEDDAPVEDAPRPLAHRLLFVGRLSPEKGMHVLIEAFNDVARRREDVVLDLVGSAGLLPYSFHVGVSDDPIDATLRPFYGKSLPNKLYRQILANQKAFLVDLKAMLDPALIKRVNFRGALPHDTVHDLYAASTIVVFPSVWNEPFGMPVAEAMAAGVPVISTDSGGIPEITDGNTAGILVPRGDAASLARAIDDLLDAPERRRQLSIEGLKRMRAHFTWPVLTRQLEAIYECAIELRQTAPVTAA
ncbi:glycosyltransferase family 4 protein [Tropicimonas marinistellae]|uniref:glycosyltransferase family 4 protein n=1 Tax=Tropicimonas marinistellae TaxID=1739787 RepID=UPI000836EF43|nr:glycosyltransferase family 4 protein [Tropicimonas marinistellae]